MSSSDTSPMPVQALRAVWEAHLQGRPVELCLVCEGRAIAANDGNDEACGNCAGRGYVDVADPMPPPEAA